MTTIDLSAFDDDGFVLHFGGRTHEVDAPTFGNALVSIAEAVRAINQEVNPGFALTCLPTRKQDAAFFGAIDDQMENGGLEAMVHELTNWNPEAVDLTWDSLRSPIVTEGLRQQVGMGLRGPMARLAAILESGELAGREAGGAEFYYRFHDDEPTLVTRSHLVSILHPETEKGNLSAEVKTAIAKLLGPDASGDDNKRLITYFGGYRRDVGQDADALCRDDQFDVIDLRVPMQKRDRYIKIPARKDVQETLAAFGRW